MRREPLKTPNGTKDILPVDSHKWRYLEGMFRDICDRFGYSEIRTPIFEYTELFQRGVGETTDIVTKEMYTFEKEDAKRPDDKKKDSKKKSYTLKPEGTAGVARAYIEHKLYADTQPTKMFYATPAFRYERPQAGRQRQFHQFGVEFFGAAKALADAEVISLAVEFLSQLGLNYLVVNINSIGCPKCRAKYNQALKEYFGKNIDKMCNDCKERYEKNPLRLIDCKVDACKEIAKDAPIILDYICDECKGHFEELKGHLSDLGINYKIDPTIVRGLDYYTKTVFEIISNDLGSQSTICGGGRYDSLVEECGGQHTPAVGFGMGIERLLLVLKANNLYNGDKPKMQLYIGAIGDKAYNEAFKMAWKLRKRGISAEIDHIGRSVRAQMKYADKIAAKYSVILGDNELESGKVKLKDMENSEAKEILIEELLEKFEF